MMSNDDSLSIVFLNEEDFKHTYINEDGYEEIFAFEDFGTGENGETDLIAIFKKDCQEIEVDWNPIPEMNGTFWMTEINFSRDYWINGGEL